jgi:energy-coupling factor transporter ATP-binding protein EcfA2
LLLLLHVALQPLGRKAGQQEQAALIFKTTGYLLMSEPIITFDKVNKWYGNNFHVLRDIDLTVAKGERIVICGPSGSGKSTLIRCINRLEEHQEGRLTVDGIELTDDVKGHRPGAQGSGHGVPAVQPVSPPHRAGKPDALAHVGRQNAQKDAEERPWSS